MALLLAAAAPPAAWHAPAVPAQQLVSQALVALAQQVRWQVRAVLVQQAARARSAEIP